jgi:hypothetical protein
MIIINDKSIKDALNRVAATDDGKIIFAWLKDACAWDATILSSDNPTVTQYHSARRGVYGGIRQHIKRQYLKEIEFEYVIKNEIETKTKKAGK